VGDWIRDKCVTLFVFTETIQTVSAFAGGGGSLDSRTNQVTGAPHNARYEALLNALQTISVQRDLHSLVRLLGEQLRPVVEFSYFDLLLYDPVTKEMTLFFPGKSPELPADMQFQDGPGFWVWENQKPLVCRFEELERKFPTYAESRRQENLKVYCAVPLTTFQRRIGILHFASSLAQIYDTEEVEFIQRVASQIAIAIDNAINFESSRQLEEKLAKERDHLRNLLEVTNAVLSKLDLEEMLAEIAERLTTIAACEYASVLLYDESNDELKWQAASEPPGRSLFPVGTAFPVGSSVLGAVLRTQSPKVLDFEEIRNSAKESQVGLRFVEEGIKAACFVPLISHGRALGILAVSHTQRNRISRDEVKLLMEIAGQVSTSIDNARAYREITILRDKLANEKLYLEEELLNEHNFKEIIGESAALRRVLAQVEMVATSDSTVLILGETGTGKELIARAIHNLSPRRARTLLKLNCAAMPSGLLESELFGYERGAFTGAVSQKMGRVELADKGTLFLDEVGDIPLELQPKLLRVLQEREFERVGGRTPIRVDVRLIVATNRDLEKMVSERLYRSDLYYRFNVFPIVMPPLRERPEDIPLLVRHFAKKYADRMDRRIESIPSETMQLLSRLPWPGNVRELENLIERAVILTQDSVLNVPFAELSTARENLEHRISESFRGDSVGTERDLILRTLRETHGVVAGPKGAAARLGMSRSTLFSRLQLLNISAKEVRNASRLVRMNVSLSSTPPLP